MTRSVFTVEPQMSALQALRYFRSHGIRRAPVVDHGRLVGILAQSDLYKVLPITVASQSEVAETEVPVSAAMSHVVHSLSPDQHLEDAARLMLQHKFGGLPVVQDGSLVGILTESDVFRALIDIATSAGEIRITFQPKHEHEATLDPLMVALRAGAKVHTYLTHQRPGGERLHLLRISGGKRETLVQGLEQAGYVLVEWGSDSRPQLQVGAPSPS